MSVATLTLRSFSTSLRTALFESPETWTVSEWFSRIAAPFRDFLTFVIHETNSVTACHVFVPDGRDGMPDRKVRVLFQLGRSVDSERRYIRSGMIATYSDVAERFGRVLDSWIQLNEEIDSVISLYMLVRYNKEEISHWWKPSSSM